MSNEEQFEHIENKIRQSIQDNPPAFDEKAWDKMEVLLDKEKKKPKPFYWLWFLLPLLLVGAGSAYFFFNKNKPGNTAENTAQISIEKTVVPSSQNSEAAVTPKIDKNIPQTSTQENAVRPDPDQSVIKEKQISKSTLPQKKNAQTTTVESGKQVRSSKSKTKATITPGSLAVNISETNDRNQSYKKREKINITDRAKTQIKTSGNEPAEEEAITDKKAEDKRIVVDADIKKIETDSVSVVKKNEKKSDSDIANPVKKKQVQSPKKQFPLYFLGSIGADIGSVKLFSFSNSSLAAKYGVGVGYQFTKKWSLQTGFYAGKKKYAAGPGDYHVKEHSYWSYYPITKVKARCMIYEIPVTIRYNVLQKQSIVYYTTIGVSSYLMKKEDYNYYYLWNNMPSEKYISYTGNQHLFSTLSLSAGIEKKVSSTLSIQFEPSVSLPLSGVGDGKVKLFSTAFMLGVKYFPFKK